MNYIKFISEYAWYKIYEKYVYYFNLAPNVTDDKFEVKYIYNGNEYVICFPNKGRMCPFKKIEDENGYDVTKNVKRYAGPQSNFHMIPTTPKMIGYSKLIFTMKNNKLLTFEEDDVIFY
jgi:hypothetical protein